MKPQKTNKSHSIGEFGERYAARYLRLHGYTVKERNYRAGHHEIDIIAANFTTIAFVEVKTRSYSPEEVELLPPPRVAVRVDKQRFTRMAARQYLYEQRTSKKPRMDVIEIWVEASESGKRPRVLKLHHMKGAY